ncbi:hypothetical protein PLESTB_001166600 [Pleodorina starrii]|uniref:Uncharacterized protein n=1 Tax=Pleodorina starrii TaxID=330485 RepID=A0A9W6BRS8_9CHLO|nr:hypothetical protein PLESTB_001166600 [Pleodorina starrii]
MDWGGSRGGAGAVRGRGRIGAWEVRFEEQVCGGTGAEGTEAAEAQDGNGGGGGVVVAVVGSWWRTSWRLQGGAVNARISCGAAEQQQQQQQRYWLRLGNKEGREAGNSAGCGWLRCMLLWRVVSCPVVLCAPGFLGGGGPSKQGEAPPGDLPMGCHLPGLTGRRPDSSLSQRGETERKDAGDVEAPTAAQARQGVLHVPERFCCASERLPPDVETGCVCA